MWLPTCFAQQKAATFFSTAQNFLAQNTQNGLVNYTGIKNSPAVLNDLVKMIETIDQKSLKEERKAYLINVYNLLVIHQIVQNYPIQSPIEIAGFFKSNKFNIGGEKITLDELENKILRPEYKDPRFHFVLVCGAKGCPPITSFAYTPDQLESQLEQQTKIALNNDAFVYSKDGTTYLSEIFSWYTSDFGGNNKSVVEYINKYRTTPFDEENKVKFYPYDWNLNDQNLKAVTTSTDSDEEFNLQTFTAGSLLGKGQMDITLFNTIYTQTRSNWLGVDYSGQRETFHTSLLQLTYGVSSNKRINVGVDINFKSSARSADTSAASTFNSFGFQNNDSMRVGISSIGPRLKISPFKGVNNFSIQSTFLIPTIQHPEGYSSPNGDGNLYWSDWNRYIWWNQFFVDHTIGKFQFFGEADLLFRFRRGKNQVTHLDIPMNLFVSYFPSDKITLYLMSQHVTRYTQDINQLVPAGTDWVIPMNYTASGAGFKYQFSSRFNIELLYTNFWRGKNSGLGSTFNVGLKYITG